MQTSKKPWFAGAALAASALALGAMAGGRRAERRLDDRVAALAASVERLRGEAPPPERVVEYHTTREVVGAADAPVGGPHPDEREGPDGRPRRSGPFDPEDSRAYAAGRGPHPVERLFEREGRARGGEPAARQHTLETAMSRALEGVDAAVHDVECRASSCRIDATFASTEESNGFARRMFLSTLTEPPVIESDGVYMPVQEASGDRHHSVFYVMRKTDEEGG